MLQICFIMCQNFSKKVAELRKYWKFIRKICLSWYQNLFPNFKKLEKLSRNYYFLFLFSLTLDSFKSNLWQNRKSIIPTWYKQLCFCIFEFSVVLLKIWFWLKTSGMLPCHNLQLYVRIDLKSVLMYFFTFNPLMPGGNKKSYLLQQTCS